MAPKIIGLLACDGVIASHLCLTADAFAAACLQDGFGGFIPCYKTWVIGLSKEPFLSHCGTVIQPHKTLKNAPPLDTLIICGGTGFCEPALGAELADWILGRASKTVRFTALGNGIYALAPTGLLDGREVTSHWRYARDLQRRYPTLRVSHSRGVVKDGPCYTTAGVASGVDLALTLIEEDYGSAVVVAAQRELMTHFTPGTAPDESGRTSDSRSHPTDRFADLVGWIMRNLDRELTVQLLAREAGLCPAHFTRAFKSIFGSTPGDFIQNLRLNEARRRLASRNKALRTVAASVGFSDAAAFRRAFRRRFGVAPDVSLPNGRLSPSQGSW